MIGSSSERISLGTFPTPLEPAPRLAAAVGLRDDRLWLKRDDLTGLGGGGNKVRKLERTLAAALRNGADCLVTTGAAQSNHARLTAPAGARPRLPDPLAVAGRAGRPPRRRPCRRGGSGRTRVVRRPPCRDSLRREQPRRRHGLPRRRP